MKILHMFMGAFVIFFALLSDIIVIAAIICLLYGHVKSIGAWLLASIWLYLWFFGRNTKVFGGCNDKPFSAWKPSTMKSFWKNWNEL